MSTTHSPLSGRPDSRRSGERVCRVVLLGNPNTGKTTTFNSLTGLRHKTSNFAGTTVEARLGTTKLLAAPASAADGQPSEPAGPTSVELIDLPGLYSLELDQIESALCREVLSARAAPAGWPLAEPRAVVMVMDATNLARNLPLLGEVLRRRLPTVVAINMIDLAEARGAGVDCAQLARTLGCPVVPIAAKSGRGVTELRAAIAGVLSSGTVPTFTPPGDEQGLRQWADSTFVRITTRSGSMPASEQSATDRIDLVLTHPVMGSIAFAGVMALVFAAIFSLAQVPMGLIESVFGTLSERLVAILPPGLLADLLTQGVVAGVGATLIFLPQICLLFFLISLLEDTGYLARGAFVMDRLLRPFGLPGHAFVPLLSSHACALPGIIAARCIPDPRERLATILVAPFMTCSARLPVYVLLIGILFPGRPLAGALAFVGCYVLGIAAGVLSALVARRTILRGKARPMALELPSYKMPSLKTAAIATYDRAKFFIVKAGTVILAICIVLWWLGAFPRVAPPAAANQLREQASAIMSLPAESASQAREEQAAALSQQASDVEHRHGKASSYIGQFGRFAQPVFAPIGADWQLTIGIMASFAAREVFVGTMSVVLAGSEEGDDDANNAKILDTLVNAVRDDGQTRVFNPATCWAILVFYVLAMQCLPTLAVTAREAGHIKWAVLQLVWMSLLAFVFAAAAYKLAGG